MKDDEKRVDRFDVVDLLAQSVKRIESVVGAPIVEIEFDHNSRFFYPRRIEFSSQPRRVEVRREADNEEENSAIDTES